MGYLPIDIYNKNDEELDILIEQFDEFEKNHYYSANNYHKDDFLNKQNAWDVIKYMSHTDFFNCQTHKSLSAFFKRWSPILFPNLGKNDNYYYAWRDSLMSSYSISLWGETKQVYTVDDDFILLLADTDNVKIPVNITEMLPYLNFCIDLTQNKVFPTVDVVYVCIKKDEHGNLILVYTRCDGDYRTTSSRALSAECVKDGYYEVVEDFLKWSETKENWGDKLDMSVFVPFIYQLMLYLCAINKDMLENSVTKKTYKPSNKKKNIKFTDVQKWDVGYRVGNAYRLGKKRESYEYAEEDKNVENSHVEKISSYRPKRPHCRRAHWQRYHVGVGRTETVIKWIGITFVNGKEIPATIHKIKKGARE